MIQNQVINSLETLAGQIPRRAGQIECFGMNGSERALLITRLYEQLHSPIFVVTPSTKVAETLLADLRFFKPSRDVPLFLLPSYNILPFKLMAYHNETAARRICALYQLLESATPPIVVAAAETLLQKVVPKQEIINYAELLMAGEEIDRERLIEKLIAGGYTHAAIVEEPGDFCVRGGILDIYCPLYPDPLRIEFFGDIAESIRFFSAASQRTIQSISEAVILPAREMILYKALQPQTINRIRSRAAELEIPPTEVRTIVDSIKDGHRFAGLENLISLVYPELDTVFDFLPDDALVISTSNEDLTEAVKAQENHIAKTQKI